MKTTAAVVYEPGKPIEIEELDLALLGAVEVELLDLDPLAGLDDDRCLGLHAASCAGSCWCSGHPT